MKKFEFIENLKSDVMFKAYGKSLEELFVNAALALFSVICQIDKIEHKKVKLVEVKGNDLEDLMLNWLQKLIGIVDT
ncbi:archease, partial [Candidatus Bathyarchaeota archaeon]|nr:archease [Candidatus Bathyarchaeota archaeon]